MKISRREFLKNLKAGVLAVAALFSGCAGRREYPEAKPKVKAELDYSALDPRNPDNFLNPLNVPGKEGLLGILEVQKAAIEITAKQEALRVLKGKDTRFFVYRVNHEGKTYINPIFKIKKGEAFSARLINELEEETIIHWHGLHVDWRVDGHPS